MILSQTTPLAEPTLAGPTRDYERVAALIDYLQKNLEAQPSLDELAHVSGLSKYHLQRMFKRWAGVTPKQFLQVLTLKHAKQALAKGGSLLDASYDVGLSSPSRLHDLFTTLEAVTPHEYRTYGEGMIITYGQAPTPFGQALIGLTDRGICYLVFMDDDQAMQDLKQMWRSATLIRDDNRAGELLSRIFEPSVTAQSPLPLLVRGTNFQVQVWRALLQIPFGHVVSYGHVAKALGRPKAARAVGTAVGQNSLGYIIPCHRVIATSGVVHHYRWGSVRKQAILAWESCTPLTPLPTAQ